MLLPHTPFDILFLNIPNPFGYPIFEYSKSLGYPIFENSKPFRCSIFSPYEIKVFKVYGQFLKKTHFSSYGFIFFVEVDVFQHNSSVTRTVIVLMDQTNQRRHAKTSNVTSKTNSDVQTHRIVYRYDIFVTAIMIVRMVLMKPSIGVVK